jgi:hypothetical protein
MTGKRTKVTICEPDYAHWSKMTVLMKSEAIALLLGIDPNSIDLEKPLPVTGDEAKKFQALLNRAFESGAFQNASRISPEDLISWAISNQLQAPQGFIDAVKKQGRPVTNWQLLFERLEAENLRLHKELDATSSEAKQRESGGSISGQVKEIKTLQKILLGIAIHKFHFDPSQSKSSAVTNIVDAIEYSGLKISADTVRRHLSIAAEDNADEIRKPT